MELKQEEITKRKVYEQEIGEFKYVATCSQYNDDPIIIDIQIYKDIEDQGDQYIGSVSLNGEYKSLNIKKEEDILTHLNVFENFLEELED